jgi:RNA polymerase sigma-70 factor (ECF subfamily)
VGTALARTTLYETLYREHRDRIDRLCRVLLTDADEAADVAQDVFAKLHHATATEVRTMDWRAWLSRVAVNACRDRRRSGWWRWWRERGLVLDESTFRGAVRTPEDEVIGRETQARVWAALRRLPARQREVFALRQLDGHSTAEVAVMLGIAAGSVKTHLFRAVHELRRAMGDDT